MLLQIKKLEKEYDILESKYKSTFKSYMNDLEHILSKQFTIENNVYIKNKETKFTFDKNATIDKCVQGCDDNTDCKYMLFSEDDYNRCLYYTKEAGGLVNKTNEAISYKGWEKPQWVKKKNVAYYNENYTAKIKSNNPTSLEDCIKSNNDNYSSIIYLNDKQGRNFCIGTPEENKLDKIYKKREKDNYLETAINYKNIEELMELQSKMFNLQNLNKILIEKSKILNKTISQYVSKNTLSNNEKEKILCKLKLKEKKLERERVKIEELNNELQSIEEKKTNSKIDYTKYKYQNAIFTVCALGMLILTIRIAVQ